MSAGSADKRVALEEVVQRLSLHLGPAGAAAALEAALATAGLSPQGHYGPQELSRLCAGLVAQGGIASLVGRALRVKALLAGAQPD